MLAHIKNSFNYQQRKTSSTDDTAYGLNKVPSLCTQIAPCSHEAKLVRAWSVDDVCQFVASIEMCKPYVKVSLMCQYVL